MNNFSVQFTFKQSDRHGQKLLQKDLKSTSGILTFDFFLKKKHSLKSILQSEQETYDLSLTLRLQLTKNLFKSSVTWLPTAASVLVGQPNRSQWPKSNLYVQGMFRRIIFAVL